MTSHTMVDLSFSPIACETRRPRSQYWRTRGSETRASTALEGARKSVAITGSQMTNTRRAGSLFERNKPATAEAPCRQVTQVGDSRTMILGAPTAALNAEVSSEKLPGVTRVSGGCPAGVVPAARKYHRRPATATSRRVITVRRALIRRVSWREDQVREGR
jgi:hypothetical protein